MARKLRQSTAVKVVVGPFLDKTDGITPEVALTVANCLSTLILQGEADAAPNKLLDSVAGSDATNTLAHIANDDAGYYTLKLSATNLATCGTLLLSINDAANHCPVFHEFEVVPAVVYDALVLGTDLLDANAAQFGGQTVTAAAGVTVPASIASPTNITAASGVALAADQAVNVTKVGGVTQTGRDIGASVLVGDKTGFALETAPPTVAEIREEIDANSSALQGIAAAIGGLPAPPAADAIREEIETSQFGRVVAKRRDLYPCGGWTGMGAPAVTAGIPTDARISICWKGWSPEAGELVWQPLLEKEPAGTPIPNSDPPAEYDGVEWQIDPDALAGDPSAYPVPPYACLQYSVEAGATDVPAHLIRLNPAGLDASDCLHNTIYCPPVKAGAVWHSFVRGDGHAVVPYGAYLAGDWGEVSAAVAAAETVGVAVAAIPTDGGGITPEQYAALAKEATVLGQFGVTWGLTYPLVRRDGVINVPRGDVFTVSFTLGAAFPLAGRKVYFCAQKRRAADNAAAIVNREATITDETARTCSITLTAAETAVADRYLYEIEVRDTDDTNTATAESGTLNIIDDLRK
jgi:hypothetical protein